MVRELVWFEGFVVLEGPGWCCGLLGEPSLQCGSGSGRKKPAGRDSPSPGARRGEELQSPMAGRALEHRVLDLPLASALVG